MASTTKSAKNGSVSWKGTPVVDVTNIDITEISDNKEYASSSTGGKKGRIAGHSDANGSFTCQNDDNTLFTKGDSGVLLIKSDASTTVYTDTVIIDDVKYGVPVGDGGPCEINVTWSAAPNLAP